MDGRDYWIGHGTLLATSRFKKMDLIEKWLIKKKRKNKGLLLLLLFARQTRGPLSRVLGYGRLTHYLVSYSLVNPPLLLRVHLSIKSPTYNLYISRLSRHPWALDPHSHLLRPRGCQIGLACRLHLPSLTLYCWSWHCSGIGSKIVCRDSNGHVVENWNSWIIVDISKTFCARMSLARGIV